MQPMANIIVESPQKPGGDEQKDGKKLYHDPTYTAKSGAQVEAERDARPYKYEVAPK